MSRAHSTSEKVPFGGLCDGERYIWWNLVSSARERIERAKADWRDARVGPVPGDSHPVALPEG